MLASLLEAGAPRPGVDLILALGPFAARIGVCAHAVHDVRCGPFSGEDALFRLLLLPGRRVRSQPRVNAPDEPMLGDVGTLLFHFLAFETELERQALRVGGFDRVWNIRFAALKTILGDLPEDVKRVIRLCDGTRDVRHLCAEGPLSPTTTLRVLERLLIDGILVRADIADDLAPIHDDGAIDADRRWQQAREAAASVVPSPATTPDEGTTNLSVTSSSTSVTTTAATTATTATTDDASDAPASPETAPPATPEAPVTSTVELVTAPVAEVRSGAEAIAAAHRHATPSAMISGETALPKKTPRPSEELQAWLGEESAFFADSVPRPAAPKHAPWPLWQLAALMVGGGIVGGVLAHACS